tara:strand:+ start:984 stop:1367 length:384 start_codon:yes stop_codon:yes gene_type:complete
MNTIEGLVAFSNVTEHDVYNGQSTGKYSLTITMEDAVADELASKGVKIKEYQPEDKVFKQRKFTSKFDLRVIDANDNTYSGEIPRNSRVRLLYNLGPAVGEHGTSTYLNAIRVIEEAPQEVAEGVDF